MNLVSVIIPNYNHAAFLKQRIDSVLNQTYTETELILLDDCSADNSKYIIEAYRNHPAVSHIVYNETNSSSTFKQWEKGIALAKGNFIWIAESDDYCEPIFLETVMKGLQENESCVIAFTQSFVIDDAENILWQSNYPKLQDVLNGDEFIMQHMLYGNAIHNASMAVFKKEDYYKISKAFTSFTFCGDWLFWIEMAKRGSVFISAKHLNFFRKHTKDVSSKAYKTGFNFFEEIRLLDLLKTGLPLPQNVYAGVLDAKFKAFEKIKSSINKEDKQQIELLFAERQSATVQQPAGINTTVKQKIKKLLFS